MKKPVMELKTIKHEYDLDGLQVDLHLSPNEEAVGVKIGTVNSPAKPMKSTSWANGELTMYDGEIGGEPPEILENRLRALAAALNNIADLYGSRPKEKP